MAVTGPQGAKEHRSGRFRRLTLRGVQDYFRALDERHGFIARSEILAAGHDDRFIRDMLRRRVWTRIRNGAYTPLDTWQRLDAVERHVRRARAVLHAHGDAVALSHVSAMVVRGGCDVWGIDLSRVHVTRRDGRSGSIERDVVHHQGSLRDDDVEMVAGMAVLDEARSLAETICGAGVESGLVVADSTFRRGRVTVDRLEQLREAMQRHRGSRTLDLVLRLADGRAQSVGESRCRYLFWKHGLPRPELQFPVFDRDGRLLGFTDLAWPAHRLLFEFDGRVKYGRLLEPGQEPGDVVFAEKRREDAIRRATGFTFERATWADLSTPAATVARVRVHMVSGSTA